MAVARQREDAARRPGRGGEADGRDVDHDEPLHEVAELVTAEVGIRGRRVERGEGLQQVADVETERQDQRPGEHHVEDGRREHAQKIARGMLRLGSAVSSARFAADSKPTKISPA